LFFFFFFSWVNLLVISLSTYVGTGHLVPYIIPSNESSFLGTAEDSFPHRTTDV